MNEKVKGLLDTKWQDWFEGTEISYQENMTILTGTIKDESNLYGILNRIRDLNLKIISVNPMNSITQKNNQNEN